ncbi:TPA: hypothetical protein MEA34_005129 [Klebsiella aerogenes]|nr:hypothetical protein [Klebsiella aerogenes]HBV9807073.1 hypothetical protein [Klebsiella aerogenes]
MSVINPISSNIFNAEFLNSPAAAVAAWISIIGTLITVITIIFRALFRYRKSHNKILKKAGVPAFALNFFIFTIPVKSLPATGWPEKILAGALLVIFLGGSGYFSPELILASKTPDGSALWNWESTNENFYISKLRATEATITSPPKWTLKASDCDLASAKISYDTKFITAEHATQLCNLMLVSPEKERLEKSIINFKKNRMIIFLISGVIAFYFSWMILGLILSLIYSQKVRRYILAEQRKAIHCAHGEFRAEGIYAIYQELER